MPKRTGATLDRRAILALILDVGIVLSMLTLDVRDLCFKTLWLGPWESYSFTVVGNQNVQPVPLRPTHNITKGGSIQRMTGWSSFLDKCEAIHPISQDIFFLHTMGRNCEIGRPHASFIAPRMVMTSAIRPDSVAWAACKLIQVDRRPVICRSRMVQTFAAHYNVAEVPSLFSYSSRGAGSDYDLVQQTPPDDLDVQAGSDAESELLDLLTVISSSAPLASVVCVEGFVYDVPGRYTSSIFGCGSPNQLTSSFAGFHATSMQWFHQDKSWLTSDWLHVMGVPYLVREISRALYFVQEQADGTITMQVRNLIDFGTSGSLYTLSIFIDIALIIINVRSTIEIARLVLWPLVLATADASIQRTNTIVPTNSDLPTNRIAPGSATNERLTALRFNEYRSVLTCPVFRSTPFALMMLVSQLISWMIVLPSSVIWTWTESPTGKIQAYLSMLRIWVIVLILTNGTWNCFVWAFERHTYEFTRRTHVALPEIAIISSVVAFVQRANVFAIGDAKYSLDHQRAVDYSSFDGFLAFVNTYPEEQSTLQNTTWPVVWCVYGPLLGIVGWSMLGVLGFAATRFAWNWFLLRWGHRGFARAHVADANVLRAPGGNDTASRSRHEPRWSTQGAELLISLGARVGSTTRQMLLSSMGSAVRSATSTHSTEISSAIMSSTAARSRGGRPYKRLLVEHIVDIPIRARSLIRNNAQMETTTARRKVYLRPSAYVEHGIILESTRLRTRSGFFEAVRYSTEAASHEPAGGLAAVARDSRASIPRAHPCRTAPMTAATRSLPRSPLSSSSSSRKPILRSLR